MKYTFLCRKSHIDVCREKVRQGEKLNALDMTPHLLNFPIQMIQENQNCFKLQSCTLLLKTFHMSLFIDPKILFHNVISIYLVQLNKYNMHWVRMPQVSYSTSEHGITIEECGNSSRLAISVVCWIFYILKSLQLLYD